MSPQTLPREGFIAIFKHEKALGPPWAPVRAVLARPSSILGGHSVEEGRDARFL